MVTKYWSKARRSIQNLVTRHKEKSEDEPRLEPAPMFGPIEGTMLSADILWKIFDIMSRNEEQQTEYRLKQIRNCSQVCREWRYILLESAPIWGRLIQIDYYRTKPWVEEIFRRSKSSPLWIDVRFDYWEPIRRRNSPYVTDDYVFALVQRCWKRTEVFCWKSENIKASGPPRLVQVWRLFQQAAPILRKFSVIVNYNSARNHASIMSNFPPFADHAPHLQEFETDIVGFLILGKSWFKNLHAINLPGSHNCISFRHLMDILEDVPQLEFLAAHLATDIPFEVSPGKSSTITPLNLPLLSWISIEFTLEQFVHFIERVKPASDCSLVCDVIIQGQILEEQLFGRLRDPLYCLFESHVACHHSGTLESLNLTMNYDHVFVFSCCNGGGGSTKELMTSATNYNSPKSPVFRILISYWDYIDEPLGLDTGLLLTQIYTTFNFNPILNDVHCLDMSYSGWSSNGSHILLALSLIQAMPLVTCLHVDNFLPRFWLEFETHNDVSTSNAIQNVAFPFPKLTTVYTDMFSEKNLEWSPRLAQLRKLLQYCRNANRPILRIELGVDAVDVTALASLAEEFEELEIVRGSIALSFKKVVNTSRH